MKKWGFAAGCVALLLGVAVIFFLYGVTVYNRLVKMEEAVSEQWSQVENVYQRRFDLIPNLVRTVQGAANFEKSTLEAVVEARSKVGQVNLPSGAPGTGASPTESAAAFQKFQGAQDGLSSALSRLLVVVERYPDLKANQNFLELQSQLEGTENRIAVERRTYNERARDFNATMRRFPGNLIAGMLGFKQKEYFKGVAGSDKAPEVNFNF